MCGISGFIYHGISDLDLLIKGDRVSMAYLLESRPPFIDDHRVVEHFFTIPHYLKYKDCYVECSICHLIVF